jgi:shikimate 5-dehydrogenase
MGDDRPEGVVMSEQILSTDYTVSTKTRPTFYFFGVTTAKSSIMNVFPVWMELLGRPEVVIEGIDLKIHDEPEAYRAAVAQIKYDPNSLGALVTTHKMDIFAAAKDMFDDLDPYAQLTHELSSISKLDGRLEGHAKDPITAGLSMDAIVGKNYFARTGGEVMCLGAGGSALATLLHLINKPDQGDRPTQLETDIETEYILNGDSRRNDGIMARLPDGSIVINATGMGKDTPGSPITDAGLFPRHGIAWEFNYRGELDFMHQALRQREARGVRVEDGWLYFLHGWSQVIAQVLHLELTDELFSRLDRAASTTRS